MLGEPGKTEHMKMFELSKFQIFVNNSFKTTPNIAILQFQFNIEYSACQSFNLTRFLRSQEISMGDRKKPPRLMLASVTGTFWILEIWKPRKDKS